MKLFKKLAIAFTCALCAACLCFAFSACEGTSGNDNPDDNLADGTYVFYVYLDDGTTPVEGAKILICYNISDTSSTCYLNFATTDANGRAEIDLSSVMQYSSYNPNGLCIHFNTSVDLTTLEEVIEGFPEGYTYPANSQTITLNGDAEYETAWYVTSQVTTFTLVKE